MADARDTLRGTHIVFADNFPGPAVGGGEIQLLHLVTACRDAGVRVTVLVQRGAAWAERAEAAGARVAEIDFSPRRVGAAIGALRTEAHDAAIIQGTGWWTNVLVRIAAGRLPRARVVNLVQVEPDASRFEGARPAQLAVRALVDRMTTRGVDAYVAVSSAVAAALARRGVNAGLIVTIHNGVDPAAIALAGARTLDPAVEGRLPSGEGPLVLCVARLAPVKGVEHFVRAAALLARTHPDARFAVAGAGSEEGRLREITVAAGLSERLAFLGNVSPIEPLLAKASVVAMPSLSEALGLVALEAGALARPVVASAVGGLVEVVDNGITGILVPAADPVALAGGIGTLLHDSGRAFAMGEAGRERVEREFGLERMIGAYLNLYAELLGR